MRAAVYAGTRNLYKSMVHSAKSLLMFSNVEKIYFLIEDDIFPEKLPQIFQCINISNTSYVKYNPKVQLDLYGLTSMVYIRAAYTKIFSELDQILTIDSDTLVRDNISELWDLDLTDYYLAAVPQKHPQLNYKSPYVNMGVAMLNLKKMREDKIDEQLIYALENKFFTFNEQDAINEICYNKILLLPSDYNRCSVTEVPNHEKILHFPGVPHKYNYPEFHVYDNVEFKDIVRNQHIEIKLDIIIPTYKNKKGLRDTLNSIGTKNLQDINILVINDCDGQDYQDIINEYPYISFYSLQKNIGPGMVRQFGIDYSSSSYFMFMDTGDLFKSTAIQTILNTIKQNRHCDVFTWAYLERNGCLIKRHINENTTIGFVYRRIFFQIHHIHMFPECTMLSDWYVNELCRILLGFYSKKMPNNFYISDDPIFKMTLDQNSITKTNTTKKRISDFILKKEIPWLVKDESRALDMALENKVHPYCIAASCLKTMYKIYYLLFIQIYQQDPIFLIDHWPHIRQFYFDYYKPFSQLMYQVSTNLFFNVKDTKMFPWNRPISLNFNNFLEQLEKYESLPEHYLNS